MHRHSNLRSRTASLAPEYRLHLTFEDGRSGVVDLADYVSDQTVFAPFSDIGYFRRFEVDSGTLVWGEGELDIAPERLYELTTGRQITYDNQRTYA